MHKGQPEEDRQLGTRAEQPGQGSRDRTVEVVHSEQEQVDRAVRTGQLRQGTGTGQPRQDSRGRTSETRQSGQDSLDRSTQQVSLDRSTQTGQSGHVDPNRPAWTG